MHYWCVENAITRHMHMTHTQHLTQWIFHEWCLEKNGSHFTFLASFGIYWSLFLLSGDQTNLTKIFKDSNYISLYKDILNIFKKKKFSLTTFLKIQCKALTKPDSYPKPFFSQYFIPTLAKTIRVITQKLLASITLTLYFILKPIEVPLDFCFCVCVLVVNH